MTVNNKELVELLVLKTGLDTEQVEEQLRQLIDRVQTEVEKTGTFKVAGLGEFSLRDGTLYFTAEDNLATEINHKYAGMKPIELIGAYKDMPDIPVAKEPEEPGPDESVFDIEEYREREKETQKEEPVEKEIKGEEEKTEGPEEREEVQPEFDEEVSTSDEQDEKVVEKEESIEEKAAEAPPPEKEIIPEKDAEEGRDPIGKILIAAVIVIALGVTGWLVYDMMLSSNGETNNGSNISESRVTGSLNAPQNEVEKSDNGSSNSDSVTGRGSQVQGTSEQNQSKPISNGTSIAEESRQSIYGLRGGAAPEAKDGYTIVVHSLRDEAIVRRLNQELQKEGYRTIIFSASVMDTTFWRLGLGQFKTIKDATAAASTLPDQYKDNHFIKRIK